MALIWFILFTLCNLLQSVPSERCKHDFKVYVYELSPAIPAQRLAEEARRNQTYHICKKCIFEQFALEYVIDDYLSQFCGRTLNPDEADFFYLPIVRDLEYRVQLVSRGGRAPTQLDNVLLSAMESNDMSRWNQYLGITDKYWLRNSGADHIIVMPAPVTNFRHQGGVRGHFHYMIQLNSPIFLNVEFSASFTREYPVCATQKNLVMPYPCTDPDLYSGRLLSQPPELPRNRLLYYSGGHHGSCVFIREALTELVRNKRLSPAFGGKRREQAYRSSIFCPIPIGDSPSSKRQYDVMHFGCIPVILSDDLLYAFTNQVANSCSSSLAPAISLGRILLQ